MTAYPYRWRRMVAEAIAAGATCADCGTDQDLEGDHELAVSRGGLSTRANLVIRCRLHNRRKAGRPPVRVQLRLDSLTAVYAGGVGVGRVSTTSEDPGHVRTPNATLAAIVARRNRLQPSGGS